MGGAGSCAPCRALSLTLFTSGVPRGCKSLGGVWGVPRFPFFPRRLWRREEKTSWGHLQKGRGERAAPPAGARVDPRFLSFPQSWVDNVIRSLYLMSIEVEHAGSNQRKPPPFDPTLIRI